MSESDKAKSNRKKPLADVVAVWEREDGIYPDVLRVTMEGGHVVNYRIDVSMPHPCLTRNKEIMDTWEKQDAGVTVIGYKARHLDKKERRREWFSRAASRK